MESPPKQVALPANGRACLRHPVRLYGNSTKSSRVPGSKTCILNWSCEDVCRSIVQCHARESAEGSVQEVDTGKEARFLSDAELIGFLRERFVQSRQSRRQKEGTNEPKNNGQ